MPRLPSRYSHVIGVDDAPFPHEHKGKVLVVLTAFAGLRLEGVLSTHVRRDGVDSTRAIAARIKSSRYAAHTKLVLFQGIALAGFNVIDIHALSAELGMAVLVVARRAPRLAAIHDALHTRVRGGARKWALIQKAGPMEPCGGVMVQRAGIALDDAAAVLAALSINGNIPEPLRLAHLIGTRSAEGVVTPLPLAGYTRTRADHQHTSPAPDGAHVGSPRGSLAEERQERR